MEESPEVKEAGPAAVKQDAINSTKPTLSVLTMALKTRLKEASAANKTVDEQRQKLKMYKSASKGKEKCVSREEQLMTTTESVLHECHERLATALQSLEKVVESSGDLKHRKEYKNALKLIALVRQQFKLTEIAAPPPSSPQVEEEKVEAKEKWTYPAIRAGDPDKDDVSLPSVDSQENSEQEEQSQSSTPNSTQLSDSQ